MLKQPLKKVAKAYTTVFFMWFLMVVVYILLLLFVFPLYMDKGSLVAYLLLLFVMTALMHVITVCKDPGYLKKPTGVTFMQMLE